MIKSFKDFNEAISGTELIGNIGPGFPNQKLPNTISQKDTDVIFCDIDSKVYDIYEFQDLYNNYMKSGGNERLDTFSKENLEKIVIFLNKN